MEEKSKKWYHVCLCVALTFLCIGLVAWIFSNSLQPAEKSAEQSTGVMDVLQRVFLVIAPNSTIATATGETYDRIHKIVRIIAHFCEFALLGALLVWCWRSYTARKVFLFIPLALGLIIPVVDEILQSFTGGRAMQFVDILVDVAGGICGGAFAFFTVWIAGKIVEKKKRKGENNEQGQFTDSAC